MGTDQKIDEILNLVNSERELNNGRFRETMDLMKSEREINNTHFNQVSSGLIELKKTVDTLGVELKKEINQVYTSLSDDIRVFADDLDKVNKRLLKVERKIA